MKKEVFANTPIQHLNLPSVTKIENKAFIKSKLKTLIVENCEIMEEEAFIDEYINVERNVERNV